MSRAPLPKRLKKRLERAFSPSRWLDVQQAWRKHEERARDWWLGEQKEETKEDRG